MKIPVIVIAFLMGVLVSPPVIQAEEKKPYAHYWMTIETHNMSIPGMPSGEMSGMEGMMGKMMGMPEFGPTRTLRLQLNSPRPLPPDPDATQDIPLGQNMGKTLPLLIPVHEKAAPERHTPEEREEKIEKPKFRMLIYWGCSEEVRPGQPIVIDTEKMSPADFGKAFSGRSAMHQSPPSERDGWIYADWPNRKSTLKVPKDSSLLGSHFVHGNYTPDIKFYIDRMRDFMAPVEFSSIKGSTAESIRFQWKEIPTAIGYFATAMAHNQQAGETIFWSSSEVKDSGFGLMDFLTPADVQRFIKDRVVMDPRITSCTIPKGIFKGAEGSMLNFIAYGEEMNVVYPPKPEDPKEPWNPIWTVKVRLKSTGMTMLGAEEREQRQPRKMRGRESQQYKEEMPQEQVQEPPKEQPKTPPEESTIDKINKFKGLFGY
ncbi:MAG TPA: hypothetical protein VMU21_04730 [Thermodesulfovibrionales bacterium]|nr:hypothetical protein [Thermodesulfovibrionales bacterium]